MNVPEINPGPASQSRAAPGGIDQAWPVPSAF